MHPIRESMILSLHFAGDKIICISQPAVDETAHTGFPIHGVWYLPNEEGSCDVVAYNLHLLTDRVVNNALLASQLGTSDYKALDALLNQRYVSDLLIMPAYNNYMGIEASRIANLSPEEILDTWGEVTYPNPQSRIHTVTKNITLRDYIDFQIPKEMR